MARMSPTQERENQERLRLEREDADRNAQRAFEKEIERALWRAESVRDIREILQRLIETGSIRLTPSGNL